MLFLCFFLSLQELRDLSENQLKKTLERCLYGAICRSHEADNEPTSAIKALEAHKDPFKKVNHSLIVKEKGSRLTFGVIYGHHLRQYEFRKSKCRAIFLIYQQFASGGGQ